MADRKISDLTALTTPASGDYLPIVDISEAAAASKNKRITIEELMRGVPDGTAAAPGIAFETDPNTGIYRPGADQVAISTGGTQKFAIDSLNGNPIIENEFPVVAPSLDLAFALTKQLDPRVTFTRASSGTFVDSARVLQTAATDAPRFDHNPITGESLGLLVEEQRANLLLNSGTLSTQSVTVTAVAHTLHFTGTGTITLTGTSTAGPLVGTGTGESNRVTLTFTPTAGSLTLTVSGTVTNAQLEAGAFRTSYIATAGAAATRSADVASITGSNFSSWYNQTEGTVFADGAISNTGANRFIADITDSGISEEIGLLWSTAFSSLVADNGVTQANSFGGTVTANSRTLHSFGYKLNDFQGYGNAVALATDTSGTLPTVDRLTIGSRVNSTFWTNGTIKRLTYWPTRLANTTLQTITQ